VNRADTWEVEHDPHATLAPCVCDGKVTGPTVESVARRVPRPKKGEVLAAVRYRTERKRLLLGLFVADPWAAEVGPVALKAF
jgi:hypothetical protein